MDESEEFEKSFKSGRLQLTFWESVKHFGIVIFFAGVIIFFPLFHLIIHKPIHPNEIVFMSGAASIGLFFYWLQYKRLGFTKIETSLSREDLDALIFQVANQLEWIFHKQSERALLARTYPSPLSGSWGEQITILFNEEALLVNSICDLSKQGSVVSVGRNTTHVKTLVDAIKQAEANIG